jgi:hypothetical protein
MNRFTDSSTPHILVLELEKKNVCTTISEPDHATCRDVPLLCEKLHLSSSKKGLCRSGYSHGQLWYQKWIRTQRKQVQPFAETSDEICMDSIEHCRDIRTGSEELLEVAKTSSNLVCSAPHPFYYLLHM